MPYARTEDFFRSPIEVVWSRSQFLVDSMAAYVAVQPHRRAVEHVTSIRRSKMHSNHERLSGLSRFFRRPLSVIALAFAGGALISPPLHANGPAPHEHTALHEVDFMQHGMDLHLLSQRMAETCTQRASNAEVLDLCSTMVTAHQDDRMQLQSWLQSWYGNDHEARFSDAQRARLEHLQTLNGNEFERHFLRDMTALHTVMIKDGAMCEAQFYHPELIPGSRHGVRGRDPSHAHPALRAVRNLRSQDDAEPLARRAA
jgi:uncharacterized protein (DUF305 family)